MKLLLASRMYQRAATNIEPFAHRVQGVAEVLAFAAVSEHEPCRTNHAPWQGVPAIEVESAIEEHLGRDAVGDDAEVVLDEGNHHKRQCRIRFPPQILHVQFIQRQVRYLVQEHQVSQEVAHKRGQVESGRPRVLSISLPHCRIRRARRDGPAA